ncbi:MAG: hypothetical protein ACTSRZ_07180 [Promethearchaeota archaeon]
MEISRKDASSEKINKNTVKNLVLMFLECWAINSALLYWWWGQIYLKTTSFLAMILYISCLISPFAIKIAKKSDQAFNLQVSILIPSLVVGLIANILILLGWTDPTLFRYIYRCIIIMVVFGILTFYSLGRKFLFYRNLWPNNRIRIFFVIILDLIGITIYALFITNIEGII